jgi:uncharacterized protein YuzE
MSETLQYMVKLSVEEGANVEQVEEFLQDVLLDIYEQGEVESVKVVKDGHTPDTNGKEIDEVLSALDGVDTESVKKAIDTIKELEEME